MIEEVGMSGTQAGSWMRRRVGMHAVTLLSLPLLTACATVQGLKSSSGTGEFRSVEGRADDVWRASALAVAELGLHIQELDPAHRYVLASKGGSAMSYGEVVGVFLHDDPHEGRQLVEVVSKRRMATNVFAKNWTDELMWTIGVFLARPELREEDRNTARPESADSSRFSASAMPQSTTTRLSPADLDECLDEAEEEARKLNLVLSREELERCRREGEGSKEAIDACLEERTRVRSKWDVRPDAKVVGQCLAARREE